MSKKDPPRIIEDSELWDEFWQAGSAGGSCAGTCKHGITFYDSNGEFMEEGELEKLTEKARVFPDRYVALDGGTHMVDMLGMEWHWDCQKCRTEALRYQEFIWDNRHVISRFINARLATEEKEAIQDKNAHTIKAT